MRTIFNCFLLMAVCLLFFGCQRTRLHSARDVVSPLRVDGHAVSKSSGETAPPEIVPPHARVNFAFASDALSEEAMLLVKENAAWMQKNGEVVMLLEGHCDHVGSDKYNLELGDRRARQVEAALIELGVPYERFATVVSYGFRRPIASGHDKKAMQQNRRVEFVVR